MMVPSHKKPNSFYARKYRRYGQLPDQNYPADRPRRQGRVKEALIHVGLFIAGLVAGTIAGLIALSLIEKWLSNGG